MLSTISLASIFFYLCAWGLLALSLKQGKAPNTRPIMSSIALGLALHGISTYHAVITEAGYQLGVLTISSLFFWTINAIVLASALKKPLLNLFVFLMPLSIIAILLALTDNNVAPAIPSSDLAPGIISHILLSILAYSLLTIATFQALLLAYQNHQLRHKNLRGIIGILPPLQTMEALLFELLWAGTLILTASIITGLIFIEDILAQQLSHKTVFSMLSWCIYAVLLYGRRAFGWRGSASIRWTLVGFIALMLAYFGSKIVIEWFL